MPAIDPPRLILHATPEWFLNAVRPFLVQHEAENSLPLGVLLARVAADSAAAANSAQPALPLPTPEKSLASFLASMPFLAEWRVNVRTAGIAFFLDRLLIFSRWEDAETHAAAGAAAIVNVLHEQGLRLPGAVGPVPLVEAFTKQWTARSRCTAQLGIDLRLFKLATVTAPTGTPGAARLATAADLDTAAAWMHAFEVEALPEETAVPEKSRQNAATRIEQRRHFVWERDGRPVAMAGLARETPHVITINAVYTPPEHRRHGYATALVAAVSAEGLRRGKQFCVLFTDLSNPTSNSIYPKVGYRPVGDSRDVRFRY